MNFRCLSGFTLVELAVVLAVIAIVATFSTPSFVVWHKRDQIDARARAMISTLVLTRSEAIRRGARVTLCRIDAARACLVAGKASDGGVTDWSCGWALFADRDGGRVLLRMQPASSYCDRWNGERIVIHAAVGPGGRRLSQLRFQCA